jgi:hypothetical protein
MQHFKYASLKKLQFCADTAFFRTFIKSNIKLLFTYPKSIYYSQRYNMGEKFLLRDPNLFPYFYNQKLTAQEENNPLNISLSLLTATNESFVLKYPNLKPNAFSITNINNVHEQFKKNFANLNSLITTRSEDRDNLNLPVAVYSRILYASTLANSGSQNDNHKLYLDQVGFEMCVEKFLEKIEYSDSDSIAYVMFALSHFENYNTNVWNLLKNSLNEKYFMPEFSQVSPKEPHVFRYEDVDVKTAESDLLDSFGNKIFIHGYMPVFLAYTALMKANSNGVNCVEAINNLNGRFPNIKEDIQKFNASMFE